MTTYLSVTGFFRFACEPCRETGTCTFGCGREPDTLCEPCYGKTYPTGYQPVIGIEDEPEMLCDECEDLF